jgi:hypothetical protein
MARRRRLPGLKARIMHTARRTPKRVVPPEREPPTDRWGRPILRLKLRAGGPPDAD